MNKLYVLCAVAVVVVAAFFIGTMVGKLQCRESVAIEKSNTQSQIIKTIGEINAETLHTGTDDIRRILHQNYTIAE